MDGNTVDAHPVRGVEILDRPSRPVGPQLSVATRDARIVEHDVTVATATNLRTPWRHKQAFTGDHKQSLGPASGTGLLHSTTHPLGVAEDHRVAGLPRLPVETTTHWWSRCGGNWAWGCNRGRSRALLRHGPRAVLAGRVPALLGLLAVPCKARFDPEFAEL